MDENIWIKLNVNGLRKQVLLKQPKSSKVFELCEVTNTMCVNTLEPKV